MHNLISEGDQFLRSDELSPSVIAVEQSAVEHPVVAQAERAL
ncbi:hypothetical protein PSCLAVI8L_130449 [Pseudoclavibacter sp. 8L]|nr:hypothetical protein PSCLAVI8L_130449 [Pseudoclavibacter sp. 8L]